MKTEAAPSKQKKKEEEDDRGSVSSPFFFHPQQKRSRQKLPTKPSQEASKEAEQLKRHTAVVSTPTLQGFEAGLYTFCLLISMFLCLHLLMLYWFLRRFSQCYILTIYKCEITNLLFHKKLHYCLLSLIHKVQVRYYSTLLKNRNQSNRPVSLIVYTNDGNETLELNCIQDFRSLQFFS